MLKKPIIDGNVYMTLTTGPYANQTREVTDEDPMELMIDLIRQNMEWIIDYSKADNEQIFEWARADLANKCSHAIMLGRTVKFDGKIYQADNLEESIKVIDELDNAIGYGGYNVFIEKYDENGVVIGIHSIEGSVH